MAVLILAACCGSAFADEASAERAGGYYGGAIHFLENPADDLDFGCPTDQSGSRKKCYVFQGTSQHTVIETGLGSCLVGPLKVYADNGTVLLGLGRGASLPDGCAGKK